MRTMGGMRLTWSVASPRWVPLLSTQKMIRSCSVVSSKPRKLILYSKPGCCLCDGLKDKLIAAFSLSPPSDPLHHVDLQIRDITTNPEWEKAYQYDIPVLAYLHTDGTEKTLPRLSPRLGVDAIRRKIGDAFGQ